MHLLAKLCRCSSAGRGRGQDKRALRSGVQAHHDRQVQQLQRPSAPYARDKWRTTLEHVMCLVLPATCTETSRTHCVRVCGCVRVPASCAHVPISHRVLQGLMSQVLRSLLPSRLQASNRACGPLLRACRLGVNLASHRSLAAPSRVCHRLDCPRPHVTAARYPFSDNTALDAMAPMAHDSARKEKAELCCGELARLCEVQRSTPQTLSAQKLRPRQFDLQGSSTQRKFAAALWLSTFSGTRRWAVPRPVSLLRLGWMFSTGPRIV